MVPKKNVYAAPSMPPKKMDPFNGVARQKNGYIVTAREQESKETRTWVRFGEGSVQRIIEDLDAMDGDWRVISMSSPTTIHRDLQGTRKSVWMDNVLFPETSILGKAGRLDLLDPFFDPVTDDYQRP